MTNEEQKVPSVLQEAHKIIYGDREKTYGHPDKNLRTISKMWNAYISAVGERELNAKDVAILMILLKTARLANDPNNRDSVVDICGYAALIERCKDD